MEFQSDELREKCERLWKMGLGGNTFLSDAADQIKLMLDKVAALEAKEKVRIGGEEMIYSRMRPGALEEYMHHVPEMWMRLLRASRRAPTQMTDEGSRRALQNAISAIDSTFIHINFGRGPDEEKEKDDSEEEGHEEEVARE